MRFRVEWTLKAQADLERLFEFLIERELERENGDLALAGRAIETIRSSVAALQRSPSTCREADDNSSLRELVIAFGATGYLALFEITPDGDVLVVAIRHQREAGYHD